MYVLILFVVIIMISMSIVWTAVKRGNERLVEKNNEHTVAHDFVEQLFDSFGVLATGGTISDIGSDMDSVTLKVIERLVYWLLLMSGLVVFAILVGIITSGFESLMTSIEEGKSKVAERHHTLILGWNQSTLRVVTQIAFLRRAWRVQNERWDRKWFPWRRVPPSSPVAKYPVVVMADFFGEGIDKSKSEMQEELDAYLRERGINPKRTKVGYDIVCRKADPTSVHDLVRVNVKSAVSIMVMMMELDEHEEKESDGCIVNGATIRTMLALRSVLCASKEDAERFDKNDTRIVVQLQKPSRFVNAASFRSWKNKKLIETMDLSLFVNTLMFLCASKPNLSQVVMSVLNFEEAAIRCRRIDQIRAGPRDEKGFLIGKTYEEAVKENCWKYSVLIGVTNTNILYQSTGSLEGPNGETIGICPEASYKIQPDDLAMFVSPVSMPKVSDQQLDLEPERTKQQAEQFDLTPFEESQITTHLKIQQKLLVCGWRSLWVQDPARLKARIHDVCKNATKESYICFKNQASPETFAGWVEDIGDPVTDGSVKLLEGTSHVWRVKKYPYVVFYHSFGDAAKIEYMEDLFRKDSVFRTAIVLSTQAIQKDLSPQSMDTRVLTILLLLKHLASEWKEKLSVISENQLDQTADIAATPGGVEKDPDFVNTQAISARGLTMALAYPRIQPALAELFNDKNKNDGSPELDLISCEMLGIGMLLFPSHPP